jgi:hypothetical protein
MRTSAPVKHTCPDIDAAIETLREVVKQLSSIKSDDVSVIDPVSFAIDEIESMLPSRWSRTGFFEQIRTDNDKLRGWGDEQYEYAGRLENELNEIKNRIDNLL